MSKDRSSYSGEWSTGEREPGTTASRWTELNGHKGDLIERCEQYSRWTIPALFPEDIEQGDQPSETQKANVAIGARLVHHLAHRIVDVMFPDDKPFFALRLTVEAEKKIAEIPAEEQQMIKATMSAVEDMAMRSLDLTAYRPLAVQAVSTNIVTGNVLIYRMPDDSRAAYTVRDYCVRRGIAGELLEVILRDVKHFGNLDPETRERVQRVSGQKDEYARDAKCTLYTRFVFSDGKWHQTQAIDNHELEEPVTYNEQDFPCLVLTWNLGRGDDYGRGLVEDYAVTFHNIDVLTSALIDIVGISADIKFLVSDSSSFDVDAYNNAARGEYVPGKEGDITIPKFEFAVNADVISKIIEKWERELSQAFLLSSAGVRDAERVTAEEIRFFAREIEAAFGGLYSRLALEWQKKEAEYQLSQIDFQGIGKDFETQVTTGMETLTREGKLDALRMSVMDLGMLEAVPEDIRAAIHPLKYAAYIFQNRGVDAEAFLYTPEEFEQKQQEAAQAEQARIQAEGEQQAAVAAAQNAN